MEHFSQLEDFGGNPPIWNYQAMVVGHGDDLLPLLVLVARVANAIAPFLATVLVPSPWSTLTSSCFSVARCATLATNACQSDPSSAHLAETIASLPGFGMAPEGH